MGAGAGVLLFLLSVLTIKGHSEYSISAKYDVFLSFIISFSKFTFCVDMCVQHVWNVILEAKPEDIQDLAL